MSCGCLNLGCYIACGDVELDLIAAKAGVISIVASSPNHTTIFQSNPGIGGKVVLDANRLRENQVYELRAFYNDGAKVRKNDYDCFQIKTELPNLL